MENKKTIDTIIAVITLFKRIMLTMFAGLFALSALGALFSSITQGGLMGVIGCALFSFGAAVCWSIRRD